MVTKEKGPPHSGEDWRRREGQARVGLPRGTDSGYWRLYPVAPLVDWRITGASRIYERSERLAFRSIVWPDPSRRSGHEDLP